MKNIQSLKLLTLTFQSLFNGGCLVILFILVPFWQQNTAEDFLSWFSKYAMSIGKIMLPLEVIPLLLSAIVFYLVYKAKENTRIWWLLNLISNIIILILFIIYFLPANSSMSNGLIEISQVKDELIQWNKMHLIRTILTAISILCCIMGLTYQQTKK